MTKGMESKSFLIWEKRNIPDLLHRATQTKKKGGIDVNKLKSRLDMYVYTRGGTVTRELSVSSHERHSICRCGYNRRRHKPDLKIYFFRTIFNDCFDYFGSCNLCLVMRSCCVRMYKQLKAMKLYSINYSSYFELFIWFAPGQN